MVIGSEAELFFKRCHHHGSLFLPKECNNVKCVVMFVSVQHEQLSLSADSWPPNYEMTLPIIRSSICLFFFSFLSPCCLLSLWFDAYVCVS